MEISLVGTSLFILFRNQPLNTLRLGWQMQSSRIIVLRTMINPLRGLISGLN